MTVLARHRAAIAIALLAGVIVFMPVWGGGHGVPGFAGVVRQLPDDQDYYLARAHDVIDGHPFLANPYIEEGKDGPPLQVWLPDYMLAAPLGFLGIPVADGYIAYILLFVPLLFFLTYLVGLELTGSRRAGIGLALLLNIGLCAAAFVRTPSPQFNMLFLLAAFLFSLRYLRTRSRRDLLLLTASFGLLFYLYPYFWTFFAAALALFAAADFTFLRDRLWRPLLTALIGGFILGAGYFASLLAAAKLPSYEETLVRIGLIYTHFPSGYAVVGLSLAALLALGIALLARAIPWDARAAFLASASAAAAVAANQHLLTGKNLEFSSHYLLVALFSAAFALAHAATGFLGLAARIRPAAIACFLVIAIAAAGYGEWHLIRQAYAYAPKDLGAERYGPVLAWLDAHTATDDVVFADEDLSLLIPAYTRDNIYSLGYAGLFFMSNEEFETRYVVNHYWDDFTDAYVLEHQRAIFGTGYLDAHSHRESENALRARLGLAKVPNDLVPQEAVDTVRKLARDIQAKPFDAALALYRADYVVWDASAEPSWRPERYPFLTPVYEAGGFTVYAVAKGGDKAVR